MGGHAQRAEQFRRKKRQLAAFKLNRRAENMRLRTAKSDHQKNLPFALYHLDKAMVIVNNLRLSIETQYI
jgi:hypothetical protein